MARWTPLSPPARLPPSLRYARRVAVVEAEIAADLAGLDLSPEALYRPTPGDALALRGEG